MNRDEIDALFVMLGGYWPNTAPDLDDSIAEAAWLSVLDDISGERAADAVIRLSKEGRSFCPNAGEVYAAVTAPVPPERADYVHELPENTKAGGKGDGTRDDGGWTDHEGFQYFPGGSLDVPHLFKKMKADLKGKPGEARLGKALGDMHEKQAGVK